MQISYKIKHVLAVLLYDPTSRRKLLSCKAWYSTMVSHFFSSKDCPQIEVLNTDGEGYNCMYWKWPCRLPRLSSSAKSCSLNLHLPIPIPSFPEETRLYNYTGSCPSCELHAATASYWPCMQLAMTIWLEGEHEHPWPIKVAPHAPLWIKISNSCDSRHGEPRIQKPYKVRQPDINTGSLAIAATCQEPLSVLYYMTASLINVHVWHAAVGVDMYYSRVR